MNESFPPFLEELKLLVDMNEKITERDLVWNELKSAKQKIISYS